MSLRFPSLDIIMYQFNDFTDSVSLKACFILTSLFSGVFRGGSVSRK